MKIVAKAISYIFHPLLLVYVIVVLAYSLDQFGYYITDDRAIGAMFIMDFFLLVLFPMIGVAMLVGLKMISGINMPKREDRIGPLLITLAFYIWFFININGNPDYPDSLRFVALAITLAVGTGFFINNFSKISLHAIGGSALSVTLVLLLLKSQKASIDIKFFMIEGYRVSAIFAILLSIVLAGAIGSSRLYLRAHTIEELYGGYLVGVIAPIIAFRIIN